MAIQSVQRALNILTLFSISRPQLGVTEIAGILELPKPTVHGILRTLAGQGFLEQDQETRKYALGLRIHELGTYLSANLKINQVGMEPVRRLAENTHTMTRIGIWDQDSILVTYHVMIPGNRQLASGQPMGPRIPAYCCAMGKAVLATFSDAKIEAYLSRTKLEPYTAGTITAPHQLAENLEMIREQGFAEDVEEYIPDLSCAGAPIFNHTQQAIGAVGLSIAPDGLSTGQRGKMLEEMKRTAMEISYGLGYIPEARSFDNFT